MTKTRKGRLVVAITGASGVQYGIRALERLAELDVESHLVLSKAGERTIAEETDLTVKHVRSLSDVVYPAADIGAAIASGSYQTLGMLVAPCSVRTMSEISTGVTSSLVSRAADVMLKERRRLVLMVRETPLHLGHLRTMAQLTEMGATIMPPVPAFYTKPETLDDMINQTVGRALDQFGLDDPLVMRWTELD